MQIAPVEDPFALDELAAQIRKSSNFRFAWQFYHWSAAASSSPLAFRAAIDTVISTPGLHAFLAHSFDPMYDKVFQIRPLHEHCRIELADGEFESILAKAAGDHLGAYSKIMRDATDSEQQAVKVLFGSLGIYRAYQLRPGDVPNCSVCRNYNSHVFSNWFFDVAWDWCLFATWPDQGVLWIGCLTDTD